MTLYEYYIIFPDGEKQEILRPIAIGSLVDINGNELPHKLNTNKIIAYQVVKKCTSEKRGIISTFYFLDQLTANELLDYM